MLFELSRTRRLTLARIRLATRKDGEGISLIPNEGSITEPSPCAC